MRIWVTKAEVVDWFNCWHKRLGPPPIQVTKLIYALGLKRNSDRLERDCDVCQRAKQTRNTFPLSDNIATEIF